MKILATANLTYNSEMPDIIMPEYGRNVQQLVDHAKTIENKAYRQAFCEEIIDLIQQLYPQSKSIEDYRSKLWQHLFQIAKYDIDVDTPTGEIPTPESARKRPETVPYPSIDTRFKHYGNNVQKMIAHAIAMPEGTVKDGFVHTIASYMKLAYRTWNREHFVSDDIIKNDLLTLSNGLLNLDQVQGGSIDQLANSNSRNRLANTNISGVQSRSNNNRNNNNRSSNNNSSNNRNNNNNNNNNRSNNNNNSSNNRSNNNNRKK